VSVRISRSPPLRARAAAANQKQQSGGGGFRFWRSRVAREEEEAVNVNNKSSFAADDSLGDTLDIHYVPDASYTNQFRLETVSWNKKKKN
jgi:hypothetical protein